MEEKVVAQEYKVRLRGEQFVGNESQILNAANAFWDVEFSFRYSDKNGAYTRKMAQRAYEVFEVLQKLTSWLDPNPKTKLTIVKFSKPHK